ncbi:MAG: aminodeoxychorismate lyase [Microgenomates bacterium 39_6]|nr:MAG: aminodeoxychorismate lyase [Microgenomates bacterium 39_6]
MLLKEKLSGWNLLFAGGFFIFLALLAGFIVYSASLEPVSPGSQEEVMFVISPGESLKSVASRLEKAGLIKKAWPFIILVQKEGLSQKIQAGSFRLSPAMEVKEIAQNLTSGSLDVWVTIIPGTRAEEVALVLKEKLSGFDEVWFENLKANEGYLMPDSYLIPQNASWDDFWQIIRKNYQTEIDKEILLKAQDRGLDEEALIILASLVEREAKTQSDQQIIAGILLNRIRGNWPLQVDATVQYALANQNCQRNNPTQCVWWPKVTGQDIKTINSPYNTYQNKALPPGPICNPSPGAIYAVAGASENSPYWYYISDPSGELHLAKTLAEHEENINRYLR